MLHWGSLKNRFGVAMQTGVYGLVWKPWTPSLGQPKKRGWDQGV